MHGEVLTRGDKQLQTKGVNTDCLRHGLEERTQAPPTHLANIELKEPNCDIEPQTVL